MILRSFQNATRTAVGRHQRLMLALVLLLGLLIRLPFIGTDFNATNDIKTYLAWVQTIQARGLATIYTGTGVDYPPVLLYLFSGAASIEAYLVQHVAPHPDDGVLIALIKLPSILADILTVWLIAWRLKRQAPGRAVLAGALYAFNPAIWYVSAYWGQTDSIYTLLLVLCVVALERKAVLPAWLVYVLALATKPQSIALAPLLLVWSLAKYGVRGLAGGLAIGAIAAAVLVGPWLTSGHFDDIIRVYMVVSEPPRVDVSAYNLWYLLTLGRATDTSSALHPAGLPLSFQEIGIGLFGALAVLIVGLTVRRGNSMALLAAALSLGLFMLMTQIHERYLFPTVAFLLLGAAEPPAHPGDIASDSQSSGVRLPSLWWAYGLLSLTFLFNLVTIAPFTPVLGTNLVAAQVTSVQVLILKRLSLLVAGLNLIVLIWLVLELASARGDRQDLGTVSNFHLA